MEANSTIAVSNSPATNGNSSFLDMMDDSNAEKEDPSGPAIREDALVNGAATSSLEDEGEKEDFEAPQVNGDSNYISAYPSSDEGEPLAMEFEAHHELQEVANTVALATPVSQDNEPTMTTVSSSLNETETARIESYDPCVHLDDVSNEQLSEGPMERPEFQHNDAAFPAAVDKATEVQVGYMPEEIENENGLNSYGLYAETAPETVDRYHLSSNHDECHSELPAKDPILAVDLPSNEKQATDGLNDYVESGNLLDEINGEFQPERESVRVVDKDHSQQSDEEVPSETKLDDTELHNDTAKHSNDGEESVEPVCEADFKGGTKDEGDAVSDEDTTHVVIDSQESGLNAHCGDFAKEVDPHSDSNGEAKALSPKNSDEIEKDVAPQNDEEFGGFNRPEDDQVERRSIEEEEEDDDFGDFDSADTVVDNADTDEFGGFETLDKGPADDEPDNVADEEDEFGDFGAAEGNSDGEDDDDFGQFDDGRSSGVAPSAVHVEHDDDFGDFGESNYSEVTTSNPATSDPILQNVQTVFSRLFRREEVETNNDQLSDGDEDMTLGEILQVYSEKGTYEVKQGAIGLSELMSQIQEIHAQRGGGEGEVAAVTVYGHDRNPFISPLKPSDCRLSTEFSIGWQDGTEKASEGASAQSKASVGRPMSKDVEEFASLIPDLSFMLSDKLCLPK